MAKKAVSVTLAVGNLTWLRARAIAAGSRSVSEFLDKLIDEARAGATPVAVRSVVGTIDIDPADPFLKEADEVIRSEFGMSLARPTIARQDRPHKPLKSKKRA